MYSNQILFLFLPIKLFALKLTWILDLLALFLESLMGQIIDLLNIMNILFTFVLCMIINFEWSLRSHEIWVSLRVVVGGHLLPVERETYYGPHIIWSVMHGALGNELIKTLIFAIEIISRLVETVHVFLTFRNVCWWLIVGWLGLSSWFTDSLTRLSIASHGVVVGEFITSLRLLLAHNLLSLASLRVQLPIAWSNTCEGHSISLRGVHGRV